MGTKACKLCYMHTTSVDGGLICEMHHRQEMHDATHTLTAECDALKAKCEAMRERVRDVVSMCALDCNEESYCGTCGAILLALDDNATTQASDKLRSAMEASGIDTARVTTKDGER